MNRQSLIGTDLSPAQSELSTSWHRRRAELGHMLLVHLHRCGLFRTWLRDEPQGWELVSGVWSPFYIQCRGIPSDPEVFSFVGDALAELVRNEVGDCNHLVGLATAGVPLAASAALRLGIPMSYTRKLPGIRNMDDLPTRKDYGEHALVEGELKEGARVVLVDDVSAQFTSKQIAHWQVTAEVKNRDLRDVFIPAVVVLVDREQGSAAKIAAAQLGLSLLSVVKLKSEGLDLLRDILLPREHMVISAYLADPDAFQDPRIRETLLSEAQEFRKSSSR